MLLLALLACAGADDPPTADLVWTGTLRLDAARTTEAVAVLGDEVAAVGPDALALIGPGTEEVALEGVGLPGFLDNHTHLLPGSFVWDRLLLVGVSGMNTILAKTQAYVSQNPGSDWVIGYGWILATTADASGVALDGVVGDRPAVLFDSAGHAALANSAAMAAVGIDADTPDPPGGRIVRDPETGAPTGLLLEGAMALVAPAAIAAVGVDGLAAGVKQQVHDLFAPGGVTSIAEVLAVPGIDAAFPEVFAGLDEAGDLDLRVFYYLAAFSLDDLERVDAVRAAWERPRVRFAGVKLWVDGSTGAGEAWSLDPVVGDDEGHGLHFLDEEQLVDFVREAELRGFALKLHVNGDGAVHAALNAMERVEAELGGLEQRYVFDHLALVHPEDYPRLVALGVTVSVQPAHKLGGALTAQADLWSDGRFERTWDVRGLTDAGLTLALGTDWPVWPEPSVPGTLLAAHLAGLSAEEALDGVTWAGAAGLGMEGRLGCLDPGCLADLTEVDVDPLEGDPEVLHTWVGGVRAR